MPKISRFLVKASLSYLVLALLAGIFLAVQTLGIPRESIAGVFPVYLHLLVVGWIVELCLGKAFWILPRYRTGPPRGNESLGWAAFALFNVDVLLAASTGLLGSVFQLAGRVFEALGAVVFAAVCWGRLKPLVIQMKKEERLA